MSKKPWWAALVPAALTAAPLVMDYFTSKPATKKPDELAQLRAENNFLRAENSRLSEELSSAKGNLTAACIAIVALFIIAGVLAIYASHAT